MAIPPLIISYMLIGVVIDTLENGFNLANDGLAYVFLLGFSFLSIFFIILGLSARKELQEPPLEEESDDHREPNPEQCKGEEA